MASEDADGPSDSADRAAQYGNLIELLQAAVATSAGPGQLKGSLEVALPASVGQPALMALYRQLAGAVNVEVSQVLISKSDLDSSVAMHDLGALLGKALEHGLLPIVNGNDATDPNSALDNDHVAVAVAVAVNADLLLLLTSTDGVLDTSTPAQPVIGELTPHDARGLRITLAGEGRGGMRSKLDAGACAAYCGVTTRIASATHPDVVHESLLDTGGPGTLIRAAGRGLAPTQRWIGGIAYPVGTLFINAEAETSIRAGTTLFLSGIKRVEGDFPHGAVVELVDVRSRRRLIGRGVVALPAIVLGLLRALTPEEVASAVSILFRLRHEMAASDTVPSGCHYSPVEVLDQEVYRDCAVLAHSQAQSARRVYAQLQHFSEATVSRMTDALIVAEPKLAASFLLDGTFRAGKVTDSIVSRRAARGLHAIHRNSLVVYAGSA